ncbi:PREDICTED: keratin, type I cytoskeletal 19-like [Nanorana parkeri]|uniref:keratin, type I cytoskeletal 19-like n=1 Tax=Nanorana parkeri TaxID=125878 RepID=UPI00085479DB|nr:PREDICTED: keratin, type I cytoskeletal 19-like [Nanorana parkeri]
MSLYSSKFLSSCTSINGGIGEPHGSSSYSMGTGNSLSRSRSLSSSLGRIDFTKDYLNDSLLSGNEKHTMQNLNDRLASYLEKVRSLEEANAELEKKIIDWQKNKSQNKKKDYSSYEKAIADLQTQLLNGHVNGAKLTLQMENAKLALDDFKRRYDTEKAFRAVLETDVEGLRRVMDNLTIVRTDLEMDVEGMRKQLIYMRKSHEEDMRLAQAQKQGSTVNVEVDAPKGADLAKCIAEVRKDYEAIIANNRKEAEEWYTHQSTTVQKEVNTHTEALQSSKNQTRELKRTLQNLEIEMQAELSKKQGLENTLDETQCHAGAQLQKIQELICQMENELSKVRNDLERQSNEYKILLDIKSRLENEIGTYRRLIDGNNSRYNYVYTNRKVKTIVQDMVNGRVVNSRISEIPQKI